MAQIYILTMTDVIIDVLSVCWSRDCSLSGESKPAETQTVFIKSTNNLTESKAALRWLNNHMSVKKKALVHP